MPWAPSMPDFLVSFQGLVASVDAPLSAVEASSPAAEAAVLSAVALAAWAASRASAWLRPSP